MPLFCVVDEVMEMKQKKKKKRTNTVAVRFNDEEFAAVERLKEKTEIKSTAHFLRKIVMAVANNPKQLGFVIDMPHSNQLDIDDLNRKAALLEQAALIINTLHKNGLASDYLPEKLSESVKSDEDE